ncbi:MAG TPA: 50S ribosomal protein L25 [Patescibacteria group bacterium]|jgi:large subunit ribosomal protein L25|nr:50S ribosomal protein L25 [Patescibacteria group bacterium]
MGDKITLTVAEREVHGKKVKQLRAQGLVPGVVYGPGMEPMSIQVAEGELKKVVVAAGKHSPVHLSGKKRRIAMIKDVDIDPVRNEIHHISFHAVRADQPVVTEVPIVLTGMGESEAEKNGLIILQTIDRVQVKALPMDLPESIEVSVLELKEEGEKITLEAAKLPENVEFVEHDDGHHVAEDEEEDKPQATDQVVATVWEPSALAAANDAAGGSAEDESEVESEHGEEEPAANDDSSSDANSEKSE